MRLLLDEMYADAIASELRVRGHDAVTVREITPALAGVPDEGRLVRALDALLGDPPPIRDRSIFLR